MNFQASPGAVQGTAARDQSSNVVTLSAHSTVRKANSPHNPGWEWQTQAACRGDDTNSFYSDSLRGNTRLRQEEAAKQVCAGCPVMANCLRWALKTQEPYGVWGGLTTDERQELLAGQRSA